MTLLLSILWLRAAAAQDCVERIPVEQFSQRVQGLREPVALVEEGVAAEVHALQQALEGGCVDEPVRRNTLAALFMAEGAYAILQGRPEESTLALAYAATLGGASAQDPIYGPTVGRLYGEILAQPRAQTTLTVALSPAPDVLVIDGELRYDPGPYTLYEGVHVLQWVTDERWSGAVVRLRAGQPITLGDASTPSDAPEQAPDGLALELGIGLGYARLGAMSLEQGLRGPGGFGGGSLTLSGGARLPLSDKTSVGLSLGLGGSSGRHAEHSATQGWGQLMGEAGLMLPQDWTLELGLGWAIGRSRFNGLDPASYEALICPEQSCEGAQTPSLEALAAAPLLLRWGGPALSLGAMHPLPLGETEAWSLGLDVQLARSSARWMSEAQLGLRWAWPTGWSPL